VADQNQNPFAVNTEGPFSEFLRANPPQIQQNIQQQRPSGFEGPTGRIAFFLDSFLKGAQQGQYRKQQMEVAKQQQADQTVNSYLQMLSTKDPGDPRVQQAINDIITERGKQAMSFLEGGKGKGKGQQQHPVLGALKSLGEGMLGGPVKKWEGYGPKIGEWAQVITSAPTKEQGFNQQMQGLNSLIQDTISRVQGGNASKQVYLEDIAGDPNVRNKVAFIQSNYGVDPTTDWKSVYPSDPVRKMPPSEQKIERLTSAAIPEPGPTQTPGQPVTPGTTAPPATPRSITPEQIQEGVKRGIMKRLGVPDSVQVSVVNTKTGDTAQAYQDPVTKELYSFDNPAK
jgi:hypothetical protein